MQKEFGSQASLLLRQILPKLERTLYKGQTGKVGIIGGSKDYTGAPYYSAISSLKAGADISHIFCYEEASIPIKCYSPEFIVHPCLDNREELEKWLDAITSLVIGPGLGRDELRTEPMVYQVLEKCLKKEGLSIVGDADFLWYLSNSTHRHDTVEIVKKFKHRIVLTPNNIEFERLHNSVFGMEKFDKALQNDLELNFIEKHPNQIGRIEVSHDIIRNVASLASELNNIVICKKGIVDIITDGIDSYYVAIEGSSKRCGGQGDVFGGIIGAFIKFQDNFDDIEIQTDRAMLSVVASSVLTRTAAQRAFNKKKIGVTTPDIIKQIPEILADVYDQKIIQMAHKL